MKSESVYIGPSNGSPLAQKNHTSGQTHARCGEQDGVTGEGKKMCFKRNCFQRVSGGIVWCLETLFYKLGYTVACHPIKTIFIAILVCGAMGIGLLKWREEILYVELWLPRGSRMYDEYFWVQKNFPASARYESVIIEDENILSSDTINAMMDIYLRSTQFKTGDGNTLDNLCVRSGSSCRVNSLLELWSYNESIIRNLTSSDILDAVNADHLVSLLYQNEIHVDTILGGIRRNKTGKITGAGATTMLWLLERNKTIEESAKDWEQQLLNYINDEGHRDIQNIYIYAQRTWEDEGMGAVTNDAGLLTVGFSIVLVYVTFTIGNYSMVHHKILLAFCGLSSTALAFLFTLGLGFVTGIMYGVIHQILPFMLLGIGVDDMFVIVEAYKHLTPKQMSLPVEERIALTLRHAGVSITVTSITDIVAFGIGGTTVIPSLSTFCIYAAIGVFILYILQATYFVACLTLDQRRQEANKNACIFCYTHKKDYKPNKYYRFSIQNYFFKRIWGPLLTKLPVKIIVIIIALGLFGVNTWSFTKLKQDFDTRNYLPSYSYSLKYLDADRKYFPEGGRFVLAYFDQFDYYENLDRLEDFKQGLSEMSTIQEGSVDFWLTGYTAWLNSTKDKNITVYLNEDNVPTSSEVFYTLLQQFLFSREGRVYLRYVKPNDLMNISYVKASALTFRHIKFDSIQDNINAMDQVRDFIDSFTFKGGGTCFVYNDWQYMFNETNKVLKTELYRNLLLAAVCVFIVTLILIAKLWTSILVFICVVFTVIDVAGTLQFWGVTIDTASSVLLILCFGLAVDYSAHVGHSFMTILGTKNDRVKETLVVIGPAVFSGGFSTFLAFLLLVKSSSYGFVLFFRIFTSVVAFGLFHGLTFLPVVLSLIGPEPYGANISEEEIKAYTDMAYTNTGIALESLSKPKTLKQENGGIANSLTTSNSEINGFNQIIDKELPSSPGKLSSYYEQMSNGTMVWVPNPDYSPVPSLRRLSDGPAVQEPVPDYAIEQRSQSFDLNS